MHGWCFAMCSMEKRATDHARQLVEKIVGRPFFDLPYARGLRRMSERELDAGLDWVDDRFHLIRRVGSPPPPPASCAAASPSLLLASACPAGGAATGAAARRTAGAQIWHGPVTSFFLQTRIFALQTAHCPPPCRYEDDQLPNIDWVLGVAKAAVYRYGIRGLGAGAQAQAQAWAALPVAAALAHGTFRCSWSCSCPAPQCRRCVWGCRALPTPWAALSFGDVQVVL